MNGIAYASTRRTSRRRAKRSLSYLPKSTVYVISFKSRGKTNRLKIRCQGDEEQDWSCKIHR